LLALRCYHLSFGPHFLDALLECLHEINDLSMRGGKWRNRMQDAGPATVYKFDR
jgi:hypothetical protein